MKTMIDKIFCAEIDPEMQFFSKDSEYAEAVNAIVDIEEKLTVTLNQSQKEMLRDYEDRQHEINFLTSQISNKCGFKHGALIILEING